MRPDPENPWNSLKFGLNTVLVHCVWIAVIVAIEQATVHIAPYLEKSFLTTAAFIVLNTSLLLSFIYYLIIPLLLKIKKSFTADQMSQNEADALRDLVPVCEELKRRLVEQKGRNRALKARTSPLKLREREWKRQVNRYRQKQKSTEGALKLTQDALKLTQDTLELTQDKLKLTQGELNNAQVELSSAYEELATSAANNATAPGPILGAQQVDRA